MKSFLFCVMHSHVLSPMAGRFSQKAAVNRYTLVGSLFRFGMMDGLVPYLFPTI